MGSKDSCYFTQVLSEVDPTGTEIVYFTDFKTQKRIILDPDKLLKIKMI